MAMNAHYRKLEEVENKKSKKILEGKVRDESHKQLEPLTKVLESRFENTKFSR